MRPTRCGASHAIARRSVCTRRPTSGRCTLTTTSSPVRSRAAWTWAIEAAAIGVSSNEREHRRPAAVRGRPRRCRRTTSNGSAGTWSRQRLNSSTSSGGNRPSPDEMIWPSLMNVGPSASAASRSRRGQVGRRPPGRPPCPACGATATARRRRPSRATTTTPRRPGGNRRGVISAGTCWAARPRSCSASAHHAMASRSSTHGASSAKAPHSRSARCDPSAAPGWRRRRARFAPRSPTGRDGCRTVAGR